MTWIRALPMCVSVLAIIGCSTKTAEPREDQAKREQLAEEKTQADYENAIQDLVSRHGAVRDWEKSVGPKPFTIELQRALVPASGSAVLVRAELSDIAFSQTENRYIATFAIGLLSRLQLILSSVPSEDSQPPERTPSSLTPIDLIYRLECAEEDADRLLAAQQSSNGTREFALVARIASVQKIGFKIDIDESDGSSELTVEHPDQFLARGSLLDFIEAPSMAWEFPDKPFRLPAPLRPPPD
jgi:hypothetical protein